MVPPNLRAEYLAEGNVGHAGGASLLALLIVPLVGAAIGSVGNSLVAGPSRSATAAGS